MDRDDLTIEALAAAIARSPIVVARPTPSFPAGFDATDLVILEWIAAEGKRIGRSFTLM